MRSRSSVALFVCLAASVGVPATVYAQCADGSAPPCEAVRRAAAAKAGNSVAVLYLETRSRDSSDSQLAAAVTEEMIEALGADARLDVRSHFVSRALAKGDADPLSAAKLQRLGWLVSGAMRATADSIELRVELTRAADGRVDWTRKFAQTRREFASLMSTMAGLISGHVAGRMLPQSATKGSAHRPDPSAYLLLVRAKSYFRQYTDGGYRAAADLLEQALKIDSLYADAYGYYAITRLLWRDFHLAEGAAAQSLATKALSLNPEQPEALQALAASRFYANDYSAQVESLARRAVALAPRSGESRLALGVILVGRGKPEEAVAALRAAVAMDSLSPILWVALRLRLAEAGRFDEAIAAHDHLVQMDAVGHSWPNRRRDIAVYRARQGRCDESVAEARELADTVLLIRSLACQGKKGEARMLLDDRSARLKAPVDPLTWAFFGEADSVVAAVSRLESQSPGSTVFGLMVNSQYDPYRKDPRIVAILRRAGVDP